MRYLGRCYSKRVHSKMQCLCQDLNHWTTFFTLQVLLQKKKTSAKLNTWYRILRMREVYVYVVWVFLKYFISFSL